MTPLLMMVSGSSVPCFYWRGCKKYHTFFAKLFTGQASCMPTILQSLLLVGSCASSTIKGLDGPDELTNTILAVPELPEVLMELKAQVTPLNVCAKFVSGFAFLKPCEYSLYAV